MTMIVHGFPNEISALRFEWAWTYPHASRRLRHLFPTPHRAKGNKETKYEFCIRVMLSMINTCPWNRLPLTIRWLDDTFRRDFPPTLQPPLHMPVTSGWIKVTKVKDDGGKSNRYAKGKGAQSKSKKTRTTQKNGPKGGIEDIGAISSDSTDSNDENETEELMYRHSSSRCSICRQSFVKSDASLRCLAVNSCDAEFHIACLSERFLSAEVKAGFNERNSQIIPVSGSCPRCKMELLWGDLVRFKRGCYKRELETGGGEDGDDGGSGEHWADAALNRAVECDC